MDPNWLLLLPLLVWAGSAEILNGSDVTGETMSRMVKLMDGMRQQLEQLEQKNNDLTFEMEEQVRKLEKENAEKSAKLDMLEEMVAKEAGYLMTCAQRSSWPTKRNATITFDNLTANFNNADSTGGADGQLDIVTGVFTTLTAGIYEVTFSGVSVIQPGYIDQDETNDQYFYLMHNGASEGDSAEWWSRADPGNLGDIYDMGSRTVILMLQVHP